MPVDATFFYDAYADLVTERIPHGAIPWRACLAYGQHKRLEPDVIDLLWSIISKMDAVERQWVAENVSRTPPPEQKGDAGGGIQHQGPDRSH